MKGVKLKRVQKVNLKNKELRYSVCRNAERVTGRDAVVTCRTSQPHESLHRNVCGLVLRQAGLRNWNKCILFNFERKKKHCLFFIFDHTETSRYNRLTNFVFAELLIWSFSFILECKQKNNSNNNKKKNTKQKYPSPTSQQMDLLPCCHWFHSLRWTPGALCLHCLEIKSTAQSGRII